MKSLGYAAILAGVVMIAEPALAADSFVGAWALDVAKSSFSPGPAPDAMTFTTRDIGDGKFNTTIDVTGQNSKVMHFDVTYANDGADYPVAGPVPGETVSSRHPDPQTLETKFKIDGKSMSTTTEVMAADSNTITSTTIGTTPNGAPIKNFQIYERKTNSAAN